jgi:hypothetical protein
MYNETARIHVMKPIAERLATICSEIGRDFHEIKLTGIVSPKFPEDPKDFKQDSSNTLLGPDVGSAIEELNELEKIGVSHLQIRCLDKNSLMTFCEKVIPGLNQ